MLQPQLHKDFIAASLPKKLLSLKDKLTDHLSSDKEENNKVIDDLYAIAFHAVKHKNRPLLLEVAETLKLAYGQKICRDNEDEYWQAIVFSAISAGEFQAVEYLLEGSKLLLKQLPDKRAKLIDLIRVVGVMSMENGKLFIGARIVQMLSYWLAKLQEQEQDVAEAIVVCFKSIGIAGIKSFDKEFFRELCVVMAKNLSRLEEKQEQLFDGLLIAWLDLLLQNELPVRDWERLFIVYSALRQGVQKDFYSDLAMIVARYANDSKADYDQFLQDLLGKLFREAYYQGSEEETALAVQATAEAFKSVICSVGWQRALFIFSSWFKGCLRLQVRLGVVDLKGRKRKMLVGHSVRSISEAASFCALTIGCMNDLQIILLWREFFLQQAKSDKAKDRINGFWSQVFDEWRLRHPLKVCELETLAESFNK